MHVCAIIEIKWNSKLGEKDDDQQKETYDNNNR